MVRKRNNHKPKQKRRAEFAKPEPVRLNRYMANSGLCSRRDADEHIRSGKVKVNERVVTELGTKVLPSDKVTYKGRVLSPEKFQYVLLNKPKDFITTVEDTHNRKTVMQLVNKACKERIYPVGRLDRHTTGLLLFTNDGDLAKRLTHPSRQVKKIYQVEIDKPIAQDHFNGIVNGVALDEGRVWADELAILDESNRNLGMEIHGGRNRVVRRIFEHFGYKVVRLDRVMFGMLTKKDLPRGKWRHLSHREIISLKSLTGKGLPR